MGTGDYMWRMSREAYDDWARQQSGPVRSFEADVTGARDVPVCMGTATRPACKYYKASNAGTDAAHWCMAMYDLVTGEQMVVACVNARADMRGCGRDGSFYEPVTGWSKVRVGL